MWIARLVSMLGVGIASLLLWSLPSVESGLTQTGTPGPDVMNGTAGNDGSAGSEVTMSSEDVAGTTSFAPARVMTS